MDRIHREARLDRLAQCPMGHDTRHYYKWLDEIDELTKQNAKLLEALKLAIIFIPDGFPMPLGWGQVVAQAESAIKEAEGRS